jgi:hypothetical protein
VNINRVRLEAVQKPSQAPQVPRDGDPDDVCKPASISAALGCFEQRERRDAQMAAAIKIHACSSVGLNKPGSRSPASPGRQSLALGAAVDVGLGEDDEDVGAILDEVALSVNQGGGVVGEVSELARVEDAGGTMTADELARVRVLRAVEVTNVVCESTTVETCNSVEVGKSVYVTT